jgi:Mrp family chromosome partitioning ATPase
LSETSSRWSVLQAVIEAAHDPLENTNQQYADPGPPNPGVVKQSGLTEQRYAALLARLLANETTHNPQRILFVAACLRTRSTAIALGVTRAAAAWVGRALLVDGWAAFQGSDDHATIMTGTARDATHLVLPDTFVPRLHHYRLGSGASDTQYLFGPPREEALASLTASFKFVAIDAPPTSSGPVANALAGSCSGCVVVVGAGVTNRADFQNVLGDLRCAGANILGTILTDAAENLPRWAGGRGDLRSPQAGRDRA